MIGLMILLFFGLYLVATIWVTRATARWAKRNNRSPWRWGGLAAFVMYNLVFWDFIPTLAVHKYYCSTEAGFFVYKTPEQWKKLNPDLTTEELKPFGTSLSEMPYKPLHTDSKKIVLKINSRIYLDSEYEKNVTDILPIHKRTSFIADTHDEKKLAQLVTFQSGYGNPMTIGDLYGLKRWLSRSNCGNSTGGEYERKTGYTAFLEEIIKLGEQTKNKWGRSQLSIGFRTQSAIES